MPRLEIRPFTEEYLDDAAALLAGRHGRHRESEPLLGDGLDFRREIQTLWSGDAASGAVATRGGRVTGYLLGVRHDDGRWGPNVWVDPAGYAVEEPEDVRDLYRAAAGQWFDEGRTRHYVVTPATDAATLDAWHRLSFGHQHALGILQIPDANWPAGVRLAEERDVDELVGLAPLLADYQAEAPVFSVGTPAEDPEELRREILDDLTDADVGDLVAEDGSRIVGWFRLAPVERSPMHSSLARPSGAVLLAWAATRPDVRGSGVGVALTEASFAWAREQGYETVVTDWRETNLLSSRFWPRRGFRRSFIRLYRSIP